MPGNGSLTPLVGDTCLIQVVITLVEIGIVDIGWAPAISNDLKASRGENRKSEHDLPTVSERSSEVTVRDGTTERYCKEEQDWEGDHRNPLAKHVYPDAS